MERVKKERQEVQEKLRRMAKAYVDGLFPDEEYRRQRRLLEMELEPLECPRPMLPKRQVSYCRTCPSYGLGRTLQSAGSSS